MKLQHVKQLKTILTDVFGFFMHSMEGHRKFLCGGGGGILKVKILEAKYEAN